MDLVRKTPGTSSEDKDAFKESRGWFEKFKKRTGIHSVVRHGEATAPAEKFVPEFQELITSEGTYITAKEKSLPGHKPMNNRLTFMLYINSNGNYKIKPLLICHSENP